MKVYTIREYYRGQNFSSRCIASSYKEAAKIFNVSEYELRNYGFCNNTENFFDGILSYFDSGLLFEKEPKLINKTMERSVLILMIDKYVDEKYSEFRKELGL